MNASRRLAGMMALIALVGCEQTDRRMVQPQTTSPVRLASAIRADSKPLQQSQQHTQRRLWNPDYYSFQVYDISPDGRLAGYIDWRTGDLAVRDLQTGVSRNLTNKGSYEQNPDEAEHVLFSPDGSQIAYLWWDAKARVDEIRVMSIDGTGARTLHRSSTGVGYWPDTWTPDGKFILTYVGEDVVFFSTTGGSNRTLKPVNGKPMGRLRISRDGRYLVWATGRARGQVQTDLHIMNLQNNRESVLLRNSAFTEPIGWTRDGRLVFSSERGGTPGVWSLRVVDGRAQGEPQLIRSDMWHMSALTMSDDGKVFYHVESGDLDVFTASFDLATGRVQSQPRSVTNAPGDNYGSPAWSPDGRYIAYEHPLPHQGRHNRISVRSIEGDEVRELRPGLSRVASFYWLPDGQTMMLNGWLDESVQGMFRFDLRTGKTTPEIPGQSGLFSVPSFSKDGRFMYYVPQLAKTDTVTAMRLLERDLTNGRERVVHVAARDVRMAAVFALVDDGRTALVQAGPRRTPLNTEVLAISIQTGSARELTAGIVTDSTTDGGRRAIGLTPDGRSVLVVFGKRGQPVWSQLWRVPLAGDAPQRLADVPNIQHGRQAPNSLLSPDGRRILYWAGHRSTELWMLSDPQLADRSR